MKRYTDDELITMKENQIDKLFEAGKMHDDDVQRWYDLQEGVAYEIEFFSKV